MSACVYIEWCRQACTNRVYGVLFPNTDGHEESDADMKGQLATPDMLGQVEKQLTGCCRTRRPPPTRSTSCQGPCTASQTAPSSTHPPALQHPSPPADIPTTLSKTECQSTSSGQSQVRASDDRTGPKLGKRYCFCTGDQDPCMQRPHLAALPVQLLGLGAVPAVVVAERLVQRQRHLDAQQVLQQLQALQHLACTCMSAARLQSGLPAWQM